MFKTKLEEHLFNMGTAHSKLLGYHLQAQENAVKKRNILAGEVWECDLGYNVGEEKNKKRPVLVVSNNRINRTGKVVVLCITGARGKVDDQRSSPFHNSWYLLYSNTERQDMMFKPGRTVPRTKHTYDFLDKDSIIQCEEIKSVSKSRLDLSGPIGSIEPEDLRIIKSKMKAVFDIS